MVVDIEEKREAYRAIENNDSDLSWWKNAGMRKLNLLVCGIFLGQTLNGYDGSLVGGFQAMPSWRAALGAPNASEIGLLNAAMFLAGLVTLPAAAYTADRFGRRICIIYSGVANIIGTAIGAAAGAGATSGYGMFIASRIICGSGIAFALTISPIMLQECPHPKHRTWLAGLFDIQYAIGAFLAAWVNFGTSYLKSNWSWRIPYLIHLPFAVGMLMVILLIPESPRWLMSKGREAEAEAFMVKYHANGKEDDPLVKFEMQEIREQLRIEKESHQESWGQLFASPANRKRLAVAVTIACGQNLSGTAIIAYYYTEILRLVGITDSSQVTGIGAGLTTFTFVVGFVGVWLTQKIRRRPQFAISWIGVLVCNIWLIIATQRYTVTRSSAAGIATVVSIWFYNGFFWLVCGALFFSMPCEVMSYSMRAKGMMVWQITVKCLAIFNSYTNPVMLRKIGYKWYTFNTATVVVIGIAFYFVIPETFGLTLEEISVIFDDKTANVDVEAYAAQHSDKASETSDEKTSPTEKVSPVV